MGNKKTEIIKAITKSLEKQLKNGSKTWPDAEADTDPPVVVYLTPQRDKLVGFVRFVRHVVTDQEPSKNFLDDQEVDAGQIHIKAPDGMRFGAGADKEVTAAILALVRSQPLKVIMGLDAVLQQIPNKAAPPVAKGFKDIPDDNWEETHPASSQFLAVVERVRAATQDKWEPE